MAFASTTTNRRQLPERPSPSVSRNDVTVPSRGSVTLSESKYSSTSTRSALSGGSATLPGLTSGLSSLSMTKGRGLAGLDNMGNTCFMNSILQCLIHTLPLKEFCVEPPTTYNPSSRSKGQLMKSFAALVNKAWSAESDMVSAPLKDFRRQITKYAPYFAGNSQHDAQEFLVYLLEGLHEDINKISRKPTYKDDLPESLSPQERAKASWERYTSREKSFIIDTFVGQLKSTLKCQVCGYESHTYDPFFDLSLPIPRKSYSMSSCTLDDCLKEFTAKETLDGYEKPKCEKCKKSQPCTKQFLIEKFPKILVIHLKRFSSRNRFSKLDSKVDFPLKGLDLNEFASAEQTKSGASNLYNLYGVSNHSGSAFSGHYIAYCRVPPLEWYNFNDRAVSSLQTESRIVSSSAYVLFYERSS